MPLFKKPEAPAPAAPFGNRTRPQIEAALEKAREARAARSEMLKALRAGEITVGNIVSEEYKDNPVAQKVFVSTVLYAVPGLGKTRARGILEEMGLHERRRISSLGAHQRARLTELAGEE